MVGELPDVITADMLRARKSKTINFDEIEIPAELLVGLDDEEDEESTMNLTRTTNARPKAKARQAQAQEAVSAKTKKRRPNLCG